MRKRKTERRPPTPVGPLERLGQVLASMVRPSEVWLRPALGDVGEAVRLAGQIGEEDARSIPFDEKNHSPQLPNQAMFLAVVMELMTLLGARAYAVLAAVAAEALNPPLKAISPQRGWRAMSMRSKVLALVIAVIEMFVGSTMAERLISADDAISWAFGLSVALVLSFGSMATAAAVHDHWPSLLKGYGFWIASVVVLIGVSFLSVWAYGLGGGAKADDTGGLTGGLLPSVAPDEAGRNWVLIAAYLGLLLFLLSAVALSHMRDLAQEAIAITKIRLADQDAQLDPAEQRKLAVELLELCIALTFQVHPRMNVVLGAYVGGARRVFTPVLNSVWDSSSLANLPYQEPAWVPEIRKEIERLRDQGEGPHLAMVS